MRNTEVFYRYGGVNDDRPWKLEVVSGFDRKIWDFKTKGDAEEAALGILVEDLLDAGHHRSLCDLVNLAGDEEALCSCGVMNDCIRCGGDGYDNNRIDLDELDAYEFPVCSTCFGMNIGVRGCSIVGTFSDFVLASGETA